MDLERMHKTYPRLRTNVDVDLGPAVSPGEPEEAPLVLLRGGAAALWVEARGVGHRDLEDLNAGRHLGPPVAGRVRQADRCLVPFGVCVSGVWRAFSLAARRQK